MEKRELNNCSASTVQSNTSDLQSWGNLDTWKLISKASSESQGWMKTTKAMPIPGLGVTIQTETREVFNGVLSVSQSSLFVPGATIKETFDENNNLIERSIFGPEIKSYVGKIV